MIWLPLLLSYGLHAHADMNPHGLVKAKLYSFNAKVERISGIVNCEDELNNFLDGAGIRASLGADVPSVANAFAQSYNDARADYRAERIAEAGGSVEERERQLFELIPPSKQFQRRAVATEETLRLDYAEYLVDEFVRIEMTAIVLRAVRELDEHYYPNQKFKPLEYYALPGDRGRAIRLMMFLRKAAEILTEDLEPGFNLFADSMLTTEVIKQAVAVNQLPITQNVFGWLNEHNLVIYLHLLEKFHPHIKEELLQPDNVRQVR